MEMATSSSDESCSAPTDFNILSSLEELNARSSSLFEKCPLCCRPRATFYCIDCLRSGDFIHSNSRYPERYAEKKLHLFKLKKERLKLLDSIEKEYAKKAHICNLKTEMFTIRDRMIYLQLAVDESKEAVQKTKDDITCLEEEAMDRRSRVPRYTDKLGRMDRYILHVKRNTAQQCEQLDKLHSELKELIRTNVDQLVAYIFPISEVHQTKSEVDSVTEDTVTALAEATRTAYIRGRWVYTDNSTERQYCVVQPLLPGNGDYSDYCMWVLANKDAVPGTEVGHKNPAHAISGALTYTVQLVSLLAFYLDVNLPHRLCYSDFCSHELSEEKFAQKVAKLNTNVLHLCLSQRVDPELIQPRQTIHNLLLLLGAETSELGRCGPFVIDFELMQSMEDSLASDLNISDSSDDNSDENDFINEWEKVHNIPFDELSSVPTRVSMSAMTTVHSHVQARHGLQPQTTTSVTGGLVTSAAASVASWWRAAIGK